MTALKAGVAETPDRVEGRLAETKISRECAKTYTEKGQRVDDTVRITKKQAAQSGQKKGYVCKRLEKWSGPLYPLHKGVSLFFLQYWGYDSCRTS